MSDNLRYAIFAAVSTLAAAVLVWGTLLPYRKSKLYVQALKEAPSARTVNQFLTPFMHALNATSPVGTDEMTRQFTGTVGSSLQGASRVDDGVVRAFALVLDQYSLPVLERRSALSATQMLFAAGGSYNSLYTITGDERYRERGRALLLRGLEISPNRPQFLYALFDEARTNGDEEGMRRYGSKILELWPEDTRVSDILDIGEDEATTTESR